VVSVPHGQLFIEVARKDMQKFSSTCRTRISPISRSTEHFDDYVEAVEWAQDCRALQPRLMMEQVVGAVRNSGEVRRSSLS